MRGFPALTIASWCFFCCLLLPLGARGAGLTAIIQPKSQTCFYEDVKEGEQGDRKVEIFVLRGGSMSVTVRVKGPYPLLSPNSLDRPRKVNRPTLNFEEDVRAKNSIAGFAERSGGDTWAKTFNFEEVGTYEVCIFSADGSSQSKAVYVDIFSDRRQPPKLDEDLVGGDDTNKQGFSERAHDVEVLTKSLERLSEYFDAIELKQVRERRRLALQQALTDHAHSEMVFGSVVETLVFIGASAAQIFFVRRWFQNRRRTGGGESFV